MKISHLINERVAWCVVIPTALSVIGGILGIFFIVGAWVGSGIVASSMLEKLPRPRPAAWVAFSLILAAAVVLPIIAPWIPGIESVTTKGAFVGSAFAVRWGAPKFKDSHAPEVSREESMAEIVRRTREGGNRN